MAANDLFSLADLSNEVCLNIGSVDDLTQLQARKWINRALIMFEEMGYWPWQYVYQQPLATVANQQTLDVPDIIKINSLFMTSPIQRNLVLVEDRQFRAMYPNDTFTGTPYFYRMNGMSKTVINTTIIGLYPIPNAAYDLLYDGVRPITLLVNDEDDIRQVTGMPSNLVALVVEMATAIGYKQEDDVKAREQLEEAVGRLKKAYEDATTQINDRLIMVSSEYDDYTAYQDPLFPPQYS